MIYFCVILKVFNNSDKPIFFVANRGHHADIGKIYIFLKNHILFSLYWFLGGLTPGSMPPNSTMLTEEGAVFKSLKIVENNIFNEKGIPKLIIFVFS